MPRLKQEMLERIEAWADRVLALTEALQSQRCPRWVVDQLGRSGTSAGANVFEADQAMSRADFSKCLGIAIKELSESRFWIRLIARRGWIDSGRLAELEQESTELQKILNSMIVNTRRR